MGSYQILVFSYLRGGVEWMKIRLDKRKEEIGLK